MGPLNHVCIKGYKYFLTLDFTRYSWICLMKTKVEAYTHLQNFINIYEISYLSHKNLWLPGFRYY